MFRTSVLAIIFTLLGTAAFAQLPPQPPPPANSLLGQGTEQERAACHPDVMKFCQAVLASNGDDVFGILGCLQQNRAKISLACNGVLTSHGQ